MWNFFVLREFLGQVWWFRLLMIPWEAEAVRSLWVQTKPDLIYVKERDRLSRAWGDKLDGKSVHCIIRIPAPYLRKQKNTLTFPSGLTPHAHMHLHPHRHIHSTTQQKDRLTTETSSSFRVPGSIPSTHIAAHTCLLLQFQGIPHPHTDIHLGKTPMHIK